MKNVGAVASYMAKLLDSTEYQLWWDEAIQALCIPSSPIRKEDLCYVEAFREEVLVSRFQ